MQNTDNLKISLKRSNKPSSFMVDLASLAREQEEALKEQEKKNTLIDKSKDKLKSLIYKDENKKNKKPKNDSLYEEKELTAFEENEEDFGSEVSLIETLVQKVRSFFLFFKRILKLFEAVCFRTGWLLLFIVRFFYFAILAILRGAYSVITLKYWNKPKENRIWQYQAPKDVPVFHSLLDPESVAISLEEDDKTEQIKTAASITNLRPINTVQKICTVKNSLNFGVYKEKKESFEKEDGVISSSLKPKYSYLKTTLFFAGFLIMLALPFKVLTYYGVLQDLGGRVLGVSEQAIGDLKNAGSAATEFDFYEAGEQFAEASEAFLRAQEEIDGISDELRILSSIIPNNKLGLAADAEYIFESASLSSKIGQQVSFIFDSLSYEKEKSIKAIFDTFFNNIGPIKENTAQLNEVLLKIDYRNLPADYQNSFKLLQEKSGQINKSFIELSELLDKLRIVLGFEGDKRYLLIFQNNSEMRASGGFMGSFSLVDFRDGKITNMETPKGGTYDVEAGYIDRIVAPEPLHIVNPLWHFWDANWWPDWKKTAKKLAWFYENSGGSSVDGVIGITPVVAERLLEIIGPLDMQDTHGVTIDANNFWEITQTFAEEKPINHPEYAELPYTPLASSTEDIASSTEKVPGKEPKKIIGDLMEEIKQELPKRLNKEIFLGLISGLEQSLSEKHVLFYFNDWSVQSKFEELGWAGRTKKTNWDYLMVVNSNISGAKSDRKIEQSVEHRAEVQSDGRIIDTVTIKRKHLGVKGEKFSGVKNLNWMRIYLPLGSEFIEATGFWPPDEKLFEAPDPSWKHDPDLMQSEENFIRDSKSWTKIYNEDDKTVFANWVQVDPGETVEVKIRYVLPFKISLDSDVEQPYALLIEKQPGAMPGKVNSRFILDSRLFLEPTWSYPDNIAVSSDGWAVEKELREDIFLATILNK